MYENISLHVNHSKMTEELFNKKSTLGRCILCTLFFSTVLQGKSVKMEEEEDEERSYETSKSTIYLLCGLLDEILWPLCSSRMKL